MPKEYIEREALMIAYQKSLHKDTHKTVEASRIHAQEHYHIMNILENQPAADVVTRGAVEQIMWERDMAMKQLEEHGISFCCNAPDVVEVVKCKDCKFYYNGCNNYLLPMSDMAQLNTEPDDFCSYGERKDGAE